jgi:hypothetical protein
MSLTQRTDKTGNRWWVQVAIPLMTATIAVSGAWAVTRYEVSVNAEAIKNVAAVQQADHDCVTELKTQVPLIREDLRDIKQILQRLTIKSSQEQQGREHSS